MNKKVNLLIGTLLIISLAIVIQGCKENFQHNELKTQTNEQSRTQFDKTKIYYIPETNFNLRISARYMLLKSNELNRNGSYISYEIKPSDNVGVDQENTPCFREILFYNFQSIINYIQLLKNRQNHNYVYEGDWDDLKKYEALKQAFISNHTYKKFQSLHVNNVKWLVVNRNTPQGMTIRHYISFVNDTKIEVLIGWLACDSDIDKFEQKSDLLFSEIKIEPQEDK